MHGACSCLLHDICLSATHFKCIGVHPLQLCLLGIALVAGRVAEKLHITWLGEASVALLLGMLVSLLLRAVGVGDEFTAKITFKVSTLASLPPILLDWPVCGHANKDSHVTFT